MGLSRLGGGVVWSLRRWHWRLLLCAAHCLLVDPAQQPPLLIMARRYECAGGTGGQAKEIQGCMHRRGRQLGTVETSRTPWLWGGRLE